MGRMRALVTHHRHQHHQHVEHMNNNMEENPKRERKKNTRPIHNCQQFDNTNTKSVQRTQIIWCESRNQFKQYNIKFYNLHFYRIFHKKKKKANGSSRTQKTANERTKRTAFYVYCDGVIETQCIYHVIISIEYAPRSIDVKQLNHIKQSPEQWHEKQRSSNAIDMQKNCNFNGIRQKSLQHSFTQ